MFHLKQNAVPATIAILNGRIKVGLSSDELTLLANYDASKLDSPTISTLHGKVSKLEVGMRIAQCTLHIGSMPIYILHLPHPARRRQQQ